jgi:hypothetical protein
MYSRPVYNASDKVVIKFGLTLVQISDMVSRESEGERGEYVGKIEIRQVRKNRY